MADPTGPDDDDRDGTEAPGARLVSHMKVNEKLIGRSIVYAGASPPRPRRFRLPFLHRRSRAR